jgi:archaellin
LDNTQVRATVFVSPDGNTISMVLFTPTDTSGGNGIDMGNVKIQLPAGFTVQNPLLTK